MKSQKKLILVVTLIFLCLMAVFCTIALTSNGTSKEPATESKTEITTEKASNDDVATTMVSKTTSTRTSRQTTIQTTTADKPATSTTEITTVTSKKPTSTAKRKTTTASSFPPTEPGHTHKFMHRTIEPDCMDGGYTKHTCACGYYYVDKETPKTEHRPTWRMIKASTPTEEGLKEYTCDHCAKVLRKEAIPKKKEAYKLDSRVKITQSLFTNLPVYEFKKVRIVDGRSWGEAPVIEILKGDSLRVTYYTQEGEKVVFTLEQPTQEDHTNRAAISNDGTYTCQEFSSFS